MNSEHMCMCLETSLYNNGEQMVKFLRVCNGIWTIQKFEIIFGLYKSLKQYLD